MKLIIILSLTIIAGSLPQLGYAATPKEDLVEEISGSGEAPVKPANLASTDDEEDSDIYLDMDEVGSGGGVESNTEVEGSGDGSSTIAPIPPVRLLGSGVPSNVVCDEAYCFCKYADGTKVEESKTYAKRPTNCDQYDIAPTTTTKKAPKPTTTQPTIPTRARETPAANKVKEVTDKEPELDQDIEIVDPPTPKKESSFVIHSSTTATKATKAKPSSTIRNEIPSAKTTVMSDDDEKELQKKEEETNMVGDNLYLNAVEKTEVSPGGLYISHPGILAAIIGGGIVGLLCAILLVMFIIYRMRKKDEGSYPLNDSKPLKDYAYSKAPSREFYA